MTLAQLKLFFRSVIQVVAGGPAVGTPGQNRAAGVLQALDALADFVAGLGGGSVTSVDGHAPGPSGDVTLPATEVYPNQAKRDQVVGLFTSGTQTIAADVALAGDPRPDYLFAEFYDFLYGYWYKCLPNPNAPDTNGNATAWWVRR